MTEPGSVIPPAPGWWVRNDNIGTAAAGFGWTTAAAGVISPVGHASATYGFQATRAVGPATPVYDNSAISARQTNLASGTPFTWTQDVAAGLYAGPYGIVCIHCEHTTGTTMDLSATMTVTMGGVTLSSLGGVYLNNSTSGGFVAVYGANSIPAGTARTVSVTPTQGTNTFSGYASSYTYKNVRSVGTLQTSFGNNTTGSVSVTPSTANPSIVWGALGLGANQTVSGFTLTTRQFPAPASSSNYPLIGDTSRSSTSAFSVSANWISFSLYAFVGLSLTNH